MWNLESIKSNGIFEIIGLATIGVMGLLLFAYGVVVVKKKRIRLFIQDSADIAVINGKIAVFLGLGIMFIGILLEILMLYSGV